MAEINIDVATGADVRVDEVVGGHEAKEKERSTHVVAGRDTEKKRAHTHIHTRSDGRKTLHHHHYNRRRRMCRCATVSCWYVICRMIYAYCVAEETPMKFRSREGREETDKGSYKERRRRKTQKRQKIRRRTAQQRTKRRTTHTRRGMLVDGR